MPCTEQAATFARTVRSESCRIPAARTQPPGGQPEAVPPADGTLTDVASRLEVLEDLVRAGLPDPGRRSHLGERDLGATLPKNLEDVERVVQRGESPPRERSAPVR